MRGASPPGCRHLRGCEGDNPRPADAAYRSRSRRRERARPARWPSEHQDEPDAVPDRRDGGVSEPTRDASVGDGARQRRLRLGGATGKRRERPDDHGRGRQHGGRRQ
eukprot:281379-Prymnesium_polylepis.3